MAQRADTGILTGDTETGTVKWFDEGKGYGWIERDGPGVDLFVHYTAIESDGFKTLHALDRVEFEIEEHSPSTKKGPRAQRVRLIEQATERSA